MVALILASLTVFVRTEDCDAIAAEGRRMSGFLVAGATGKDLIANSSIVPVAQFERSSSPTATNSEREHREKRNEIT
jgi:hypothetical protein